MHATIKRLADEGSRRVLVIPISFVSDHVETLHEIDIEHRAQALGLGIAGVPHGARAERCAALHRVPGQSWCARMSPMLRGGAASLK